MLLDRLKLFELLSFLLFAAFNVVYLLCSWEEHLRVGFTLTFAVYVGLARDLLDQCVDATGRARTQLLYSFQVFHGVFEVFYRAIDRQVGGFCPSVQRCHIVRLELEHLVCGGQSIRPILSFYVAGCDVQKCIDFVVAGLCGLFVSCTVPVDFVQVYIVDALIRPVGVVSPKKSPDRICLQKMRIKWFLPPHTCDRLNQSCDKGSRF